MSRSMLTALATTIMLSLVACEGPPGEDGDDGVDGKDGIDGVDGEPGEDGKDGQDGDDGKDGADGQDGQDGADGADGLIEGEDVYWVEETSTISAWTGSSVYAWCEYGDIVIGGGWDSTNTYPFETIYPYDNGPAESSGYEGWLSSIANYSEDDFEVTVTAICIDLT